MWLSNEYAFPDVELADPHGIVAVGGDYHWKRLVSAYSSGIFPWSSPGQPILWWSPDPRYVIFPDKLRIKRSMRPYINQRKFRVSYDTCFKEVVLACKNVSRKHEEGTWITNDLLEGYADLHEKGFAHSVEVWDGEHLVGGLYGVAIGKVFCGESMFSRKSNASKYALIHLTKNLIRQGFWLIDCQIDTEHLLSLGAEAISRREFSRTLELNKSEQNLLGKWTEVFSDDALDDPLPKR